MVYMVFTLLDLQIFTVFHKEVYEPDDFFSILYFYENADSCAKIQAHKMNRLEFVALLFG